MSIRADKDIMSDDFFAKQIRRFEYVTKRVEIITPWYDAGSGVNRFRSELETYFGKPFIQSFRNLNNEKLSIPDDSINTITHFEVIERLLNPLYALQECHRILSDEGILYLTTPNDYSLIYKIEHLLEIKYAPHFHQFTERDLRWLLDEAGFKIIRLETFKRSATGFIARFCKNSFYVEAVKK